MFESLYNTISQFLFDGDPTKFAYGEFICEAVPAVASVFLFAVPFIIVWRIITRLLG